MRRDREGWISNVTAAYVVTLKYWPNVDIAEIANGVTALGYYARAISNCSLPFERMGNGGWGMGNVIKGQVRSG